MKPSIWIGLCLLAAASVLLLARPSPSLDLAGDFDAGTLEETEDAGAETLFDGGLEPLLDGGPEPIPLPDEEPLPVPPDDLPVDVESAP